MSALVPVEQKEVEFYGDVIIAVRGNDGGIYIPIRPICDLLGVDWNGQRRRINRDPVLSEEVRRVDITSTRRGTQEMVCLPLEYISGFLFGINADRVREDLRERIIRYRRECYRVLNEAFQEGRLTAEPNIDELVASAPHSDAVQAYQMAQAIMRLARQQIIIEAELSGRLDAHEFFLADHEQRLEDIEATLGDSGRNVTPDQASQISQAVKAVALAAGKKSGRNEFGAIYGELYRKFGIMWNMDEYYKYRNSGMRL